MLSDDEIEKMRNDMYDLAQLLAARFEVRRDQNAPALLAIAPTKDEGKVH